MAMIVGAAVVGIGAVTVWLLTRTGAPAPLVTATPPPLGLNDLPATGAGPVPGNKESMREDRGPRTRGPVTAPPPPVLKDLKDLTEGGEKGDPTPQAPLFDIESRDETWAPVSERELSKRLAAIAVDQVQVESAICKTSTCQVIFASTEPKLLGKVIGKLETPEGVYGWADHLLLGAPVTASSGTTMPVTLLFDR
ncbi:MAG: hypothetical protein KBG15_19360 [Kofleriaceae bacterium]|nr:hypothetical protein [Kofleriaceae bacterium]